MVYFGQKNNFSPKMPFLGEKTKKKSQLKGLYSPNASVTSLIVHINELLCFGFRIIS